jgi:hypothetical protein
MLREKVRERGKRHEGRGVLLFCVWCLVPKKRVLREPSPQTVRRVRFSAAAVVQALRQALRQVLPKGAEGGRAL